MEDAAEAVCWFAVWFVCACWYVACAFWIAPEADCWAAWAAAWVFVFWGCDVLEDAAFCKEENAERNGMSYVAICWIIELYIGNMITIHSAAVIAFVWSVPVRLFHIEGDILVLPVNPATIFNIAPS